MITRIMTIGPGRIYEAACALSFDKNLYPCIDKTIIVAPFGEAHIKKVFEEFNLNLNLEFVKDQDLIQSANLENWVSDTWYLQQALKLALLDQLPGQQFLIQDSDVFALRPYNYFKAGIPTLRVEDVWNDHHQIYESYIIKLTGFSRPSHYSFVTEFMPVLKQDWEYCKQVILEHTNLPWNQAIPNLGKFDETKWFSEYELLGFCKTVNNNNYFLEYDNHPIINCWEDLFNSDWSLVPTVKFKARPLKFMDYLTAVKVKEFFELKCSNALGKI